MDPNQTRFRLFDSISTFLKNLAQAAELAYHFSEASPLTGPGKLVKYSGLAGERSLEVYAHEEALLHFGNGLLAKGVDREGEAPAPDSPDAARLWSTYGSVLGLEEGQYAEAQGAFNRALTIVEGNADVSLAIRTLANAANVHSFHAHQKEALRTGLQGHRALGPGGRTQG